MSARQELFEACADALRLGKPRPDLAAELEALPRPGPTKQEGHTAHNLRLADIWCEIDDRIKAGEDEGEVLADVSRKYRIPYETLCDIWAINGRPAVRAILIERGRI